MQTKYDLRVRTPASWNELRRRQYLLRTDIDSPRSADVLVWPSLFDWGVGLGLEPALRTRLGLNGVRIPARLQLEPDKFDMLKFAVLHAAPALREAVGLTLRDASGEAAEGEVFLGFDVMEADGVVSGLTNEGFSKEERGPLALEWTPKLNRFHLFSEAHHAETFSDTADARRPDQGPHRAVALFIWEIP